MKKTLYERKKGVEYRASGSWETSEQEGKVIKWLVIIDLIFGFGFFIFLFLKMTKIWAAMLILMLIFMAVSVIYMAVLIKKKSKEEPMTESLTRVDYTKDHVTGVTVDKSVELPIEEGKTPMEMLKEHKND